MKLSDEERHAYRKVYICLFTCATTRAVHLEILDDLSITTLINAFRRFIALRFTPRSVISDNAGAFLAFRKYLRDLRHDQKIQTMFETKHIAWNFIASFAPWRGGFWERLVGSTKEALLKSFGAKKIDLDLFNTAVVEISAAINNRHLVWLKEENVALTPNQLLKAGFNEFEMMGLTQDTSDDIGEGTTPLKRRENC